MATNELKKLIELTKNHKCDYGCKPYGDKFCPETKLREISFEVAKLLTIQKELLLQSINKNIGDYSLAWKGYWDAEKKIEELVNGCEKCNKTWERIIAKVKPSKRSPFDEKPMPTITPGLSFAERKWNREGSEKPSESDALELLHELLSMNEYEADAHHRIIPNSKLRELESLYEADAKRLKEANDRIIEQDQTLARLDTDLANSTEEFINMKDKLTERADKAERERDAALANNESNAHLHKQACRELAAVKGRLAGLIQAVRREVPSLRGFYIMSHAERLEKACAKAEAGACRCISK